MEVLDYHLSGTSFSDESINCILSDIQRIAKSPTQGELREEVHEAAVIFLQNRLSKQVDNFPFVEEIAKPTEPATVKMNGTFHEPLLTAAPVFADRQSSRFLGR